MKARDVHTILATVLLLAACHPAELTEPEGKEILFSAVSEVTPSTKTEYSGEVISTVERIDWKLTDKIRIFSYEVTDPASKYSDYAITSFDDDDARYSHAQIDPVNAHGLQWGEDVKHTFYAMYPSPGTPSLPGEVSMSVGASSAEIIATLPADQSSTTHTRDNGQDYYGNMNLAYMTAANKADAGTSSVSLEFTPIVTTFYVTVKNKTGASMTLREVRLSSATTSMNGTFKTTIDNVSERSTHTTPIPNYSQTFTYKQAGGDYLGSLARTAANSTVYASFDGLTIANNSSINVALFAFPKEINNVTLTVTSDETGPVSLAMKSNPADDDSWIAFTGKNKHNLSNIGVPGVSYTLTVNKDMLTYPYTGTASSSQQYTVTSSKTIGATTYSAPWKTQIYVGSEWVDLSSVIAQPAYAWLANMPVNSESSAESTTTTTRTFQKNVTEQPVISHEARLQSNKVYDEGGAVWDNSSKANAVDLSKYNFINRRKETIRTTANTYIVAAPGWYKIPMVYGNLIEGGQTVADACKGSTWGLGHLDYFKKKDDGNIYYYTKYPWIQTDYLAHARIHWEKYTHWNGASAETTARKWSSGSDIGVITDVSVDDVEEFIYFRVDPSMIRLGNVLLATYDDSGGDFGDCCWSWQIWITDQDMTLQTVGDHSILPVNMGWIDTSEGQHYNERSAVLKFVSTAIPNLATEEMTVIQPDLERVSTEGWQTYYQWGRKDPFTTEVVTPDASDHVLNSSIKHPANIQYEESTYFGDKYFDWTSANYNNLWDSQNTAWASPTAELPNHKTVYDPSPRGFSVPPDAAWDLFSTTGYSEDFDNGLFFYTNNEHTATTFFPASGYLAYASGDVVSAGSNGYYWTSHPGESLQRRASYSLRYARDGGGDITLLLKSYESSGITFTRAYRAYAFSVRPVLYNVAVVPSDDVEGATMQEMIFGDQWNSSISNLHGESTTAGDVTVTFSRPTAASANRPSYDDATGIVTLHDSDALLGSSGVTSFTVSVPAGHNLVRIFLFFDSSDTGGSAISTDDGGDYQDGKGDVGRSGIWKLTSYTAGPPETFTPDLNSITFKLAATGADRQLTGLSVIYK